MRRQILAIAAIAVLAGCNASVATESPAGQSRPRVPDVLGLPRSRAACTLIAAGLRWRVGGEHGAHNRGVIPCGVSGVRLAPDPIVKRQRPRAGRPVRRGSVVALEDDCTLLRFKHPGSACS
ncbi:MAG TPA: PASTA domain-containing protein [Solirubrobacteraceae bacterium]|jgi:hypothetical protein|nr:PASTA domain-containing protein [Solirubrobacteraceae bacterium]